MLMVTIAKFACHQFQCCDAVSKTNMPGQCLQFIGACHQVSLQCTRPQACLQFLVRRANECVGGVTPQGRTVTETNVLRGRHKADENGSGWSEDTRYAVVV